MAYRTGTALCCADKMMVGRWYKLMAHNVGYGVPYDYKATFVIDDNSIASLVFDTLYIKGTGTLTITCTDQYGNHDTKVVELIEEPTIERSEHTISPNTWDDFKAQVKACGKYAYIKLQKKDYHYTIDDVGYAIPEGTVIDLNGSDVYFSTDVRKCRMFLVNYNHIEIRNGRLVNECAEDWSHSDMSQLISMANGYNCKLEDLRFPKATGFNIGIGTWSSPWALGAGTKWGNQNKDGLFNGYLADDGSLIASDGAYASSEFLRCTIVKDYTYFIGVRDCFIPQTSRVYDIAFYDADYNFIELRKNQQFYRKYERPHNSVFWKTCIYQDEEPRVNVGGDDYCFYRMYGDGEGLGTASCVVELYCNNLIADTCESGILSVVGTNNDCHYNLIRCDTGGTVNPWAFDVEDAWNATCGTVITHSTFKNGGLIMHGVQGASIISCLLNGLTINSTPYAVAIINTAVRIIFFYDVRNYCVMANSSNDIVQNRVEHGEQMYISNKDICGTYSYVVSKLGKFYNRYLKL